MDIHNTLRGLSLPHIVLDELAKERDIKAQHDLDDDALPAEGGLSLIFEINKARAKALVHIAGVTALYVTVCGGVEQAAEIVSRHL